jgi:hypothetical protein
MVRTRISHIPPFMQQRVSPFQTRKLQYYSTAKELSSAEEHINRFQLYKAIINMPQTDLSVHQKMGGGPHSWPT